MAKHHITHGMSGTRIYRAWFNMKRRCTDPRNNRYYSYGGRGITYDPRWEKFDNFYEDMKAGYADNLTLDRIDTDKNYLKENCRWATVEEQMNNRTTSQSITFNGKTQTVAQWARETGINEFVLYSRLKRNSSLERLLLNRDLRNLKTSSKRSDNRLLTFNNQTKALSEWAKELKINYSTLYMRIVKWGWSVEKAFTMPIMKGVKN